MAKTTPMKLVELIVLKQDISKVIEFLGKNGDFEFQTNTDAAEHSSDNQSSEMYQKLQAVRTYLNLKDSEDYLPGISLPENTDFEIAAQILAASEQMHADESAAAQEKKKLDEAYTEALSFSNLKVPYSELEHLSFLSLRIGKIDPAVLDDLVFTVGSRAVIIPLGDDRTRILAASSKKGRFALDTELKKAGFIPVEIPHDFKGLPDDVISGMKKEAEQASFALKQLEEKRKNYAETHEEQILRLLCIFSVGMQVQQVREKLESTQLVYRITGWMPSSVSRKAIHALDDMTEGRIAVRQYDPDEIPSVREGREKVPVKLTHGAFVASFERMIFSYGAPLYGTVDPTPLVAFFFTLLFGIMFGDAGQGLVFIAAGIVLHLKLIKKLAGWNKFGPIFIAIGISSTVMGLLNGEFFANHHLLVGPTRFITGLFGTPRDFILHLMPDSGSIEKLFMFFLFTVGVGFIINSVGLIINIINQFSLKRPGKALFGKTGLSGALFFWYIVFIAVKTFALKTAVTPGDWVFIAVCLLGVFLAEPFARLIEGRKPAFEHGIGIAFIEGIVEILEVLSSYLSNTVSFLRVGAFALAHAVLGFIIFTMTEMIGGWSSPGGILVAFAGNAVVIVLEGMIVAIQVIRLQYYEFFSKFFTETGKEFIPFKFIYRSK